MNITPDCLEATNHVATTKEKPINCRHTINYILIKNK